MTPDPAITVTPHAGLVDGQTVTVSGTGFTATPIVNDWAVTECRARILTDGITLTNAIDDCDIATMPFVFVHADASGSFSTPYTLRKAFTVSGPTNVSCSVTEPCAILVAQLTSDGFVGAGAPIDFGNTALRIPDCLHDAWQTHTRADGMPFRNQGDCVRYTVRAR